jgi:hypothetical protein
LAGYAAFSDKPTGWKKFQWLNKKTPGLLEIPTLTALIFPAPKPPFSLGISQHKVAEVALNQQQAVCPRVVGAQPVAGIFFWG